MSAHRIRVRNAQYNQDRTKGDRLEYRRRWVDLNRRNFDSNYSMADQINRYAVAWFAAGNRSTFPQFDDWVAQQIMDPAS